MTAAATTDRPRTARSGWSRPRGRRRRAFLAGLADPASMPRRSSMKAAASSDPAAATASGGVIVGDRLEDAAGNQLAQHGVQLADDLGAGPAQVPVALGPDLHHRRVIIGPDLPDPGERSAATATDRASLRSFCWPPRTSADSFTSGISCCGCRSGTRRGLLAESCIRAPSGDACNYSGSRCTGQCPPVLSSRRVRGPVHASTFTRWLNDSAQRIIEADPGTPD